MLQGKVALVTGAGRGIGLAIARRFCAEGATLFLAGRDEAQLKALAVQLHDEFSVHVASLVMDVSDAAQVKTAFQALFKQCGRLDVLVNNAGILEEGLLGMMSAAQIERQFAVNACGPLYCCQYGARLMQRAGGGSIINLASIMGQSGAAGLSAYAASKAAVIGMTRALAQELAPHRIRVNAISPGFIDTDMAHGLSDDTFQARLTSIAMGRLGDPDEVAKVALFLASDLSSYVTGEVIGVNGGMRV